ncbi:hypothetical protein Nepgr_013087 [Nepenthes gracilis]|uniref:Uncharacterized protein n=1 Tax=Nepenthes gracilis TaxID=150966 RepID=A0AAD3SIU9_NEPGR|nr:hypothetical protein Nepgr_013087 [Nepenthes gracilis]
MYDFSAADGFVELSECMGEMIKYVANEPSVGLYYIQQHAQHAVPNAISLKNNVIKNSRETILHTEDLEDSITIVRSMKECGVPIANEMIGDIKRSLGIMSTKQPIRGLIQQPRLIFQIGGRNSSWGPATWGRNAGSVMQDSEKMGSYLSGVFKSAKQKVGNLKWPQIDLKELRDIKGEVLVSYPDTRISASAGSTSSSKPDEEPEELPLSSQILDEIEEDNNVPTEGAWSYVFSI